VIRFVNVLAAFGHERERALVFFSPIPPNIGMGEVVVAYRFNLNNIDKLAESARSDNV
jgi:hypothetical protein